MKNIEKKYCEDLLSKNWSLGLRRINEALKKLVHPAARDRSGQCLTCVCVWGGGGGWYPICSCHEQGEFQPVERRTVQAEAARATPANRAQRDETKRKTLLNDALRVVQNLPSPPASSLTSSVEWRRMYMDRYIKAPNDRNNHRKPPLTCTRAVRRR